MTKFSYEKAYEKTEAYFKRHKAMLRLLNIFYRYIPLIVMAAYPVMLIVVFFRYGALSEEFLKTFFVPLCTFMTITVIRRLLNFKRPYEKYNIQPLIVKNKRGQSFPSRHSVSIFIISMAFLYINVYTGIAFLALGIIICVTRVLAGVHFIRDVAAGAAISVLTGIVFFFLC